MVFKQASRWTRNKKVVYMKSGNVAVVLIGMAYPYGVVRHLALLGMEIYKASHDTFDFYFASINRESDPGSWDLLRTVIPETRMLRAVSFDALTDRVVSLAERYTQVIVHTGGGWGQTKHFVRARKRMDKKLVSRLIFIGTTHSYRQDSFLRIPMSVFQYALYRLYYRMVVFQCQDAADRFVGGNDLIKRGRGAIVPLGCESFQKVYETIPDGIAANHQLRELLTNPSLFKFVYLAAFRPGKMHVWLVKAITAVLRRHPEAVLICCGTQIGNTVRKVSQAITVAGLGKQIIITQKIPRSDIPWLLLHSDCAIVPSRAETFGHNFLEPMFAGLPVIGTAVGVGRDVIVDDETGYFIDLHDPLSVSITVERILTDRPRAKRMGLAAREKVLHRYTHAMIAKQLVELYNKIFTRG